MKLRVALILVLIAAQFGCRPFVHYDPDRDQPAKSRVYTVSKGDTLYSIAWEYGHDYRSVARWNGINPPYTIYPGQEIRMYPGRTAGVEQTTNAADTSAVNTTEATSRNQVDANDDHTLSWAWPVEGKIVGTFPGSDPGKKGLDIAGRMGQSVKAAADGKVVYSGGGLRGYGKLIIIKHNTTYFSAYAYNDKLLVQENDTVKSGQRIAEMGKNSSDQAILHFEIRRNGTPQDPVKYLPKKGS
ncbi:peptidoglycan DD-metalloendopeptidase family protein [Thiohalophilus sp.]|uniref:peptidoglycan DD-metalloendopeptidase family protein n=1 Tax=Thiohalophilus sp. TaxID=3028392 RepID=UPI002ACE804C|nr:peptidoglycan DD-metalloendopeptidase family protein [Thiohalophilus sp.]MDZ7663156.1 peptidoglycan DD-metalloendopeptidase family protein [Thiohalophilus sp.]